MDNDYSAPAPTAWVGWIAFAGLMMIVTGVLGALAGLAAIVRDETYVQGVNRVWIFDETSWGWIHLIIGIAVVAIGAMMLRGGAVSMALGAGVIVIHMIAHFQWMGMYPWWSIVVIAIDVLILYALIVHGGEMAT
jgi:hypothetical protein